MFRRGVLAAALVCACVKATPASRVCSTADECLGRAEARLAQGDANAVQPYYETACELGDGRGCARRGLMARRPNPPAGAGQEWLDRARPLLASACAGGEPESCELAAEVAIEVHADPAPSDAGARALELYDARCSEGGASACLRVGVLLDEGRVQPKDFPRSLARLLRACDLGLSGGCAAAGIKFARGEGVEVDLHRSKELLHRAKLLMVPLDAGS
jgi:TPR repeat protein